MVLTVNNDDLVSALGDIRHRDHRHAQRDNARWCSNAALRFTPPKAEPKAERSLVASLLPRRPPSEAKHGTATAVPGASRCGCWRNGEPAAYR